MAYAADEINDQRLHRHADAEHRLRRHHKKHLRVDHAKEARDPAADHEGPEFGEPGVDPDGGRGRLIFTRPEKQDTRLGTLEKHGAEPSQQQNDAEDAGVPTWIRPLHEEERAFVMCWNERLLETPIGEENLQDQRIGERGQAEIDPREFERWRADDKGSERGTSDAGQHTDPGCEVEINLEDESDIAAKADERRVAKRQLPGVATNQIPGHSERGPERDQGSETAQVEVVYLHHDCEIDRDYDNGNAISAQRRFFHLL